MHDKQRRREQSARIQKREEQEPDGEEHESEEQATYPGARPSVVHAAAVDIRDGVLQVLRRLRVVRSLRVRPKHRT